MTEQLHEHVWQRRQNVTTKGYAMSPYEACECGAARPVIDWSSAAPDHHTHHDPAVRQRIAEVEQRERAELIGEMHSWMLRVEDAEQERNEARATNARLNRRVQIAEAALHELATGTGKGKARPVAAELWARCQETHERHCGRAERAEAALAEARAEGARAVLEAVEALGDADADGWPVRAHECRAAARAAAEQTGATP